MTIENFYIAKKLHYDELYLKFVFHSDEMALKYLIVYDNYFNGLIMQLMIFTIIVK